MKKLVFLLSIAFFILGFTNDLKASHAAGGEITYKYVGTPSNPYDYCITLTVYRRNESGSAGLGSTMNVNISSSCFGSQSVQVQRITYCDSIAPGLTLQPDGGCDISNYKQCTDENNPGAGFFNISQHVYKACVTLPGKCSDYTFSWSLCCRNNNITNLVNPASNSLYLESKLNNTRGPNTSVRFLNPAAKSFCVSPSPFVWSQAAAEPDGDSLLFAKGQPWTAANNPIAWASGYSTAQPMTTANGFNLNPSNGTFFFEPTTVETVVLKIVVKEYRYDSSFQLYYQVGEVFRELQVPVVSNCNPQATAGISIDSTVTSPTTGLPAGTALYSLDSLKQAFGITKIGNVVNGNGKTRLPIVPYECFDSVVTVEFNTGLVCDSFSVDGSEFRIIGPDGVLRPVVGVNTNCDLDLLTRSVDLLLHKSLDTAGDFLLYIKTGNDGNSLLNECGYPVDSFFSIIIRVDTCPYPVYDIENVSVHDDREIDIDWSIDPGSFVASAFTGWNILRANSNDQYYIVHAVDDSTAVNARSYRDTAFDPIDLDLTRWQYRIQPVINGKTYPPTDRIYSILLTDTINSSSTGTIYRWTEYEGWDTTASYIFQIGEPDTIGGNPPSWDTIRGTEIGYLEEEYLYPDCEVNRDTSGLYIFRVIADNPANPGGFRSESNWLYYKIDCDEPPEAVDDTTVIPTVFTPNNDGQNDLYKIRTNFQTVNISIYNRWGKPVYSLNGNVEDLAWDGTDQNSGQKVADGVYYYVVKLQGRFDDGQGGLNSKSMEETGSLTILTNGTK